MVFEFDNDGFLTSRRSTLEAAIEGGHRDLFLRARQINHDCHELAFTADIRNRDVRHLLIACLFTRILDHYQATVILLGTGLVAPAKVVLRAIIETVFTIRAIAANEEMLRDYINADLLKRLKTLKKAQKHDHIINLDDVRQAITPDLIDKLNEQIEASGAKSRTVEEYSKLAGMHDWYMTHYALLSDATHSNVRDLESYLSIDKAGEARSIVYAPSLDEIPLMILTAAHSVLLGADAFAATFALNFQIKGDGHVKFVDAAFRKLNL